MTAYPPPPGQPGQPPYDAQYPPPPPGSAYTPPPPPPNFGPPQGGAPWPTAPGRPGQTPVPPPPPGTVAAAKAPTVTWLLPAAALLALIGALTPWFTPHGQAGGVSKDFDSLYSFNDGKIGLVVPIANVVVAIMAIGLLQGRTRGRLSSAPDPVRSVARYAIIAGAVSALCLVIAWFFVTSQYKFELNGTELSWDDFAARLKAAGGSLTKGPQIGYWLSAAAAVVAIVGGLLIMVQTKPTQPARSGPPPAPPALQKPPPPPT